jgi:serine/threonine protein kinase
MGGKGSKSKAKVEGGKSSKKDKKNKGKEAEDASPVKNSAKEEAESNNGKESGEGPARKVSDDELDPSWNDAILFSADKKKVTKEDFELLTVIGKGSFGKVMQVKKRDTGEIFAMKVLRKEAIRARKQVAHTKAEKSILQKIQHPFIVTLHYAFQTDDKLYMILDYINGGELFFHLKKEGRFPEHRVVLYAAEIVLALSHLHSLDIVYRDLKPENILIDSEGAFPPPPPSRPHARTSRADVSSRACIFLFAPLQGTLSSPTLACPRKSTPRRARRPSVARRSTWVRARAVSTRTAASFCV